MISQETIAEIKDKISIADVVGEVVELRQAGANFTGLCPFHNEKTGSFNVRVQEGYYHCFGCGVSGNVITFVMEQQGLSFPEAVDLLASRYGIEVKREGKVRKVVKSENPAPFYKINSVAQKYFQHSLKTAPKEIKDYIASRGITSESIEKFGIGYAPNTWGGLTNYLKDSGASDKLLIQSGLIKRSQKGDHYDALRGRLIFPVWIDTKRIAGFGGRHIEAAFPEGGGEKSPKYINSPETPAYHKSKILYGFPQASKTLREDKSVYLVEGYMDVIGLAQVGINNVLAACGTAVTYEHVKRLKHSVKRVTVLFDADNAGKAAAGKLYELFLNSGLDSSALFLEEGQDPDDLAKTHGADTRNIIEAMGKIPLLQCLIQSELKKQGVTKVSELGAASKGKLADLLSSTLARIENPIERDEAIKIVARSINIEAIKLSQVVDSLLGNEKKTSFHLEEEEEISSPAGIISAMELPHSDRSLLLAVIAHKEELVDKVLNSPEFCNYLHKDSRLFIEGLSEILSMDSDNDKKKSLIKSFLSGFGRSWIDLWKEAYKMAEDSDVDMMRIYKDCKTYVDKKKLEGLLSSIRSQIRSAESEDLRSSLVEKEVGLVRQLQNM